MRKRTLIAAAMCVPLAIAVTLSATATATPTSPVLCTGTIHGVNQNANVEVPTGDDCVLKNLTVAGSVTVDPNASLELNGVTIKGNLLSNPNLGSINTLGTDVVKGNIVLDGLSDKFSPGAPSATLHNNFICGTTIGGNLTVNNALHAAGSLGVGVAGCVNNDPIKVGGNGFFLNNDIRLDLFKITLGGNLTVTGNTRDGSIKKSVIHGNFTCANTPAYTIANNTVMGHAQPNGTC